MRARCRIARSHSSARRSLRRARSKYMRTSLSNPKGEPRKPSTQRRVDEEAEQKSEAQAYVGGLTSQTRSSFLGDALEADDCATKQRLSPMERALLESLDPDEIIPEFIDRMKS